MHRIEHALALIDRVRAAGMTIRSNRGGLTVRPGDLLDPNLKRELSAAHDDVLRALRAESSAKAAIRRGSLPLRVAVESRSAVSRATA
jgi:hypothetical protein